MQGSAARSQQPGTHRNGHNGKLGRGLGLLGVGIGIVEVSAPGVLARVVGAEDAQRVRRLVRVLGARELATGLGVLATRRRAGWLWSRVAGDVIDLALLAWALRSGKRTRVIAALTAIAGVTVLDVIASRRRARLHASTERVVRRSITINRPPEVVYGFWRNFEHLPRFMEHLESVQVLGMLTSRWRAKAPAGRTVEWDAEITEDEQGERLAWSSVPGSDIEHHGAVTFARAPGDRGTEVHVELRYRPPAGALGVAIAKLFGEEPEQQIKSDLRRLKQVLETGSVMRAGGAS